MIKTYSMIMDELHDYANPKMKLNRMVKMGTYTKIVKGLYESDVNVSPYLLAGSIYGPSYISFDFALSYYGMIPEAVYAVTSATFKKNRKKEYHTKFGDFLYYDVPAAAFPHEIRILTHGDYTFQIATKEKAICDKLYTVTPVDNIEDMRYLLINDLRLSVEDLCDLELEKLEFLSELYRTKNIRIFVKYLRKENRC